MMMLHPGSEMLLAHVDGELAGDEDRDVVRHLEECTECSAAVARLRDDSTSFGRALHALDDAEPAQWRPQDDERVLPLRPSSVDGAASRSLQSHAAGSSASSRSRRDSQSWRLGGRGVLRWAAGVLLVAAATVSAAVVGVRILADGVQEPPVADDPVAVESGVAAIMVTPVAGRVEVRVSGAGAGSELFVSFAGRADARVAVEGTGSPRFRVANGRLDLDLEGAAAVVRVTLPQSLPNATIVSDDITVATVRNGRLEPADAATAGIPLDASRME